MEWFEWGVLVIFEFKNILSFWEKTYRESFEKVFVLVYHFYFEIWKLSEYLLKKAFVDQSFDKFF